MALADVEEAGLNRRERLSGAALAKAWVELRERRNGKLRPRDAAEALGVSEGELVASQVGRGAVRLGGDLRDLLLQAPELGAVKVITRNEHCVHEKVGQFGHVSFNGAMGLVVNHDIDLRLFMGHWRHAFAFDSFGGDGQPRRTIQAFDAAGDAVHKIFATPGTDRAALEALIARFAAANQSDVLAVEPRAAPKADRPDAEIDLAGLDGAWRALKDTHEFFGMLRAHAVGRRQAMRLIADDLAWRVERDAIVTVLERAAAERIAIMVFVGNPGCIQIHTGPIARVAMLGPWANVMDPAFDLHLRRDRIAEAYVVRKPTEDGVVTSLELFDADGFCFAQFFGERKPGIPERDDWRRLAESLPRLGPGA